MTNLNYEKVQHEATEYLIQKRSDHKKYLEVLQHRYIPQMMIILKYANRNSSVLDIGIREGWFLEFLRNMGFKNLYGVDVYPKSVNMARERGLKAEVLNIQEDVIDGRFNVIVMSHVLEHVQNPEIALNNVHEMLLPNGIVFIEVPKEANDKKGVNRSHFFRFNNLSQLKNFFKKEWKVLEATENKNDLLRIVVRKI